MNDKGITPIRFLEPSAGNGAFVGAFKQTFPNMETVSFEKDLLPFFCKSVPAQCGQ
jgi:hypothetical protein